MSVDTGTGSARNSHRLVIGCPAKDISAPQRSARSSQRGFIDSINAIFFDLPPALQLFLAVDRLDHFVEALPINETVAMILAREPLDLATLVLVHAYIDIVCHSDVQRPAATSDDVNPILMLHGKEYLSATVTSQTFSGSFDSAQDDRVGKGRSTQQL
jgi:hypothetical protein